MAAEASAPFPPDWIIQGIGDFNGDGKADILWRNSTSGQVYVWLMNGTTIASSGSPGTVTSDWVIQGVGDFDGDGKSDILWRNSTSGQVYLWFINGTTSASGAAPSPSPPTGSFRASAITMAAAEPASCGGTPAPSRSTSG